MEEFMRCMLAGIFILMLMVATFAEKYSRSHNDWMSLWYALIVGAVVVLLVAILGPLFTKHKPG